MNPATERAPRLCSIHHSMKFKLLIKTEYRLFLAFKLSDDVFIMIINVTKCQQLLALLHL